MESNGMLVHCGNCFCRWNRRDVIPPVSYSPGTFKIRFIFFSLPYYYFSFILTPVMVKFCIPPFPFFLSYLLYIFPFLFFFFCQFQKVLVYVGNKHIRTNSLSVINEDISWIFYKEKLHSVLNKFKFK